MGVGADLDLCRKCVRKDTACEAHAQLEQQKEAMRVTGCSRGSCMKSIVPNEPNVLEVDCGKQACSNHICPCVIDIEVSRRPEMAAIRDLAVCIRRINLSFHQLYVLLPSCGVHAAGISLSPYLPQTHANARHASSLSTRAAARCPSVADFIRSTV